MRQKVVVEQQHINEFVQALDKMEIDYSTMKPAWEDVIKVA